MKGDFSRQTFDSTRHFTTVRMQQGRVQLDADWNEQADLALYRVETEASDVIGGCGGPLDAAAFGIVLSLDDLDPAEKARLQALDPPYAIAAGDFVLTPGRYYVDGILCESEHAVPYTLQPDLLGLDPIDVSQAGLTIVYLDVWQRHLTWLDDPLLRETALGIASTIAQRSPVSVAVLRELARTTRDLPLEEGLRREADGFRRCLESSDGAEGVAAFLEKREPQFTGR